MVAPSGEGAVRCMRHGARDREGADRLHQPARHLDAGRRPEGDRGDPRGLRRGEKCPPISATKSLTGHSLGATGVQEAIYSLLMMNNGFICESAHIEELDPAFADMNIVRKRIDNAKLGTVLSNSFGFGGTNATLVIKRRRRVIALQPRRRPSLPRGTLFQPTPYDRHSRRLNDGLMQASAASSWASPTIIRSPGASPRLLAAHGAELAFTYQGEALGKRVAPLAQSLGSDARRCPATSRISPPSTPLSRARTRRWGKLDFVVHAIGFSDKNELKGRYADYHARQFLAHHGDLLLLLHRDRPAGGEAHDERRLAADAHLWRLDPGHAELQRHGRRQGGARGHRSAISRPISGRTAFAATPSRPGPCARLRAPASPMRA